MDDELEAIAKDVQERGYRVEQLLTYLKLTDTRLGLLINFGEALLKNGTQRIAN